MSVVGGVRTGVYVDSGEGGVVAGRVVGHVRCAQVHEVEGVVQFCSTVNGCSIVDSSILYLPSSLCPPAFGGCWGGGVALRFAWNIELTHQFQVAFGGNGNEGIFPTNRLLLRYLFSGGEKTKRQIFTASRTSD